MSISACRSLVLLLLTVPLNAHASPADTATSSHSQTSSSTATPQTPPQTYDQIVRLSLVEGDVRIARGKDAEHATGGDWGQATAGLPVETGFSLATGKGRAEIEFEDTSTVFLGENSVLVFDELTATGGIPRTMMTLVSGSATVHIQPQFAGEEFTLHTPAGFISDRYGDHSFLRVDSYLDAMTVAPQGDQGLRVKGLAVSSLDDMIIDPKGGLIHRTNSASSTLVTKGETITYYKDHSVAPKVSPDSASFADWDDWTTKRVTAEGAATLATMNAAGLTAPIPGLAEMKDQGTFFACAPYGTCWEPTNGWGEYEATPTRVEAQQSSGPALAQSTTSSPHTISVKALQTASTTAMLRTEYEEPFPCSPNRIRRVIARDPVTGKDTVIRTELDPHVAPYDWAVCHAGTWIHREHRYVWVAGTKRHHHCPVHWVKYGGSKAYVPMHPHDVAGKTPINLKHGVFQTTGRKGESVEHVAFNASTQVKVLPTAPKEFLKPYFPTLQHAEAPHLEAYLVKDGFAPGKESTTKPVGTAITFDHRSGSFQLARQVMEGGKNTTVTEHFGGNGNSLQARNGGGNFSGGNSGSRSAGNSGSFSHSSSNAGGGSHSSSGGGGGGGGSHAGGGGGASSGGGGGGGAASSGGGGSHK
jgi:FecR protein